MDTLCIKSPVGDLTLFSDDEKIIALSWGVGADAQRTTKSEQLTQAAKCLDIYFKTGKADFTPLNLQPHGTVFQRHVWQEMQKIKDGKTKTYGQVAKTLKSGPRAVGGACGANPLPILIPCHRIINQNGTIGHYSGGNGAETKSFLLRLEGFAN